MRKGYATGNNGKELYWILIFVFFGERSKFISSREHQRKYFHSWLATCENITDGVHSIKKKKPLFHRKNKYPLFISCFPVGYREISVKIFFDLTLVLSVKIPIFTFLLVNCACLTTRRKYDVI